MELTSNVPRATELEEFIIAPREICQSCHAASGPRFALSIGRDSAATIRTTAPLTNLQRALAEANVVWAQSEGTSLDKEILRVQQSLEKLQRQRSVIRQFEQQERGLLISHIHRLPVEVLRHIFLLAHGENPFFVNETNAIPRVVTQVCSRWCSVAQSCGELWTSVICVPNRVLSALEPKERVQYNTKYGSTVEDCVRFSNPFPFSFCLAAQTTRALLGESCIQALALCAHRWKQVLVDDGELFKAIFDYIPEDTSFNHLEFLEVLKLKNVLYISTAPQLKKLFIGGLHDDSEDTDSHIIVGSAPNLEYLRLEHISRPSAVFSDITASRITQFESFSVRYGPDEFVDVLRHMPNLISLTLYGTTETEKSVTLQSLEALTIGGMENGNVLEIITAPRLKKLHVGWGFSSVDVADFVHQSGCSLEELKLTSTDIDQTWATTELPNLTTLYWEDPYSIGESLERLTLGSTPSADDLFPGLENLHIVYLYGPAQAADEWVIDDIFGMLESRLKTGEIDSSRASLKTVNILFRSVLDDNEVAAFDEFVRSEIVTSSEVEMSVRDGGKFLVAS